MILVPRAGVVLAFGMVMCAAAATPDAAEQAKPGTMRACTLFTKAEIQKLLGDRIPTFFEQIPPRDESLAVGSECAYAGLTMQLDAAPVTQFEERRKMYGDRTKFESVAGVGDQAYFFEQEGRGGPPQVGIYARTGRHMLAITMSANPPETAASLRPALVELSRAAVAKLK